MLCEGAKEPEKGSSRGSQQQGTAHLLMLIYVNRTRRLALDVVVVVCHSLRCSAASFVALEALR
jgi:hypothetical protein